jgi:hypothetical protein
MLHGRQFEKKLCTLNKRGRNEIEEKVCCREVLFSEDSHERKKRKEPLK